MNRAGRRVVPAVVGTVAGLVALIAVKSGPTPVAGATGPTSRTGSTGASTGSATGAASSGTGTTLKTGTFTGDAADTRYGPVQVQVTVAGGKVTGTQILQVPQGNPRDVEINQVAVPILQQETVGVSSAQIDFVSGATFTSDGYQRSLQSAIDKAKG